MEKRRRARINDSLNHLKNLILPLTGRDVSYNVNSVYAIYMLFTYTNIKVTLKNDVLNMFFSNFLQKTRYSKLEKADILEMTARFLSDIPPVNTKGGF